MQLSRWRRFLEKDFWITGWYRFVDEIRNDLRHESLLEEYVKFYYSIPRFLNSTEPSSGSSIYSSKPCILYAALKYDYGDPRRGLSFEENSFFNGLFNMGYPLIRFDYYSIGRKVGEVAMNRMLLEAVDRYRPDLLFVVLFGNELAKETIRRISETSETTTLNWFCDDDWRFDTYSRHWAPAFNWVVTTSKTALEWYHSIGYERVILAPFACNHWLYRKLDLPHAYDVSFVGHPHGHRREIVAKLRRAGIDIHTWGFGWPSGRASLRQMVEIFNQSKINLNMSAASEKGVKQIKGRNFEVPGCGGFLLTEYVPGLEDYYELGKEVVCYSSFDDLVDKIRYYLQEEEEREAIAQAGYERTLRDHTYEKRLKQVFRAIGLEADSSP